LNKLDKKTRSYLEVTREDVEDRVTRCEIDIRETRREIGQLCEEVKAQFRDADMSNVRVRLKFDEIDEKIRKLEHDGLKPSPEFWQIEEKFAEVALDANDKFQRCLEEIGASEQRLIERLAGVSDIMQELMSSESRMRKFESVSSLMQEIPVRVECLEKDLQSLQSQTTLATVESSIQVRVEDLALATQELELQQRTEFECIKALVKELQERMPEEPASDLRERVTLLEQGLADAFEVDSKLEKLEARIAGSLNAPPDPMPGPQAKPAQSPDSFQTQTVPVESPDSPPPAPAPAVKSRKLAPAVKAIAALLPAPKSEKLASDMERALTQSLESLDKVVADTDDAQLQKQDEAMREACRSTHVELLERMKKVKGDVDDATVEKIANDTIDVLPDEALVDRPKKLDESDKQAVTAEFIISSFDDLHQRLAQLQLKRSGAGTVLELDQQDAPRVSNVAEYENLLQEEIQTTEEIGSMAQTCANATDTLHKKLHKIANRRLQVSEVASIAQVCDETVGRLRQKLNELGVWCPAKTSDIRLTDSDANKDGMLNAASLAVEELLQGVKQLEEKNVADEEVVATHDEHHARLKDVTDSCHRGYEELHLGLEQLRSKSVGAISVNQGAPKVSVTEKLSSVKQGDITSMSQTFTEVADTLQERLQTVHDHHAERHAEMQRSVKETLREEDLARSYTAAVGKLHERLDSMGIEGTPTDGNKAGGNPRSLKACADVVKAIEGLSRRTESSKQQVETIRSGTFVVAKKSFMTDDQIMDTTASNIQIEQGTMGCVYKLDADGDAVIKFDGLQQRRWVLKCNLHRLGVVKAESSPFAQPAAEPSEVPSLTAEPQAQTSIQIGRNEVAVTAEIGIDCSMVLDAKAFKDWSSAIARERRIKVSKIHIESLDMFGPSKVGFIKCKVDATRDGSTIPGIVFLRGGMPAILVVLQHRKRKYTVVVRQARVPVCKSSMVEIPAGMLDDDGNFAGAAAKELKEQTGIQINETDLINMSQLAQTEAHLGVYSTCGGSDEYNPLFLYHKNISAEMLARIDGKLTGAAEEGEAIKLQILPLEQLWRMSPDAKTLSAVCFYERLRACGRIPELPDEACPSAAASPRPATELGQSPRDSVSSLLQQQKLEAEKVADTVSNCERIIDHMQGVVQRLYSSPIQPMPAEDLRTAVGNLKKRLEDAGAMQTDNQDVSDCIKLLKERPQDVLVIFLELQSMVYHHSRVLERLGAMALQTQGMADSSFVEASG
jgi:ADP-sugar diphosphatase